MKTGALPLFIAAGVGILAFSGGKAAGEQLSAMVRSSAGRVWETRFVKRVGEYSYIDVFKDGARVLRYKQKGDDKTSRVFVAAPAGVSATLLAQAKKDFGL